MHGAEDDRGEQTHPIGGDIHEKPGERNEQRPRAPLGTEQGAGLRQSRRMSRERPIRLRRRS